MGCPAMGFKSVDDFGGLLSTLRQAFQVEHSTSLRGHGHQAMHLWIRASINVYPKQGGRARLE